MNINGSTENKSKNNKNDAISEGINNRQHGTLYGGETYGFEDSTDKVDKRDEAKRTGGFSGDPSTMRKAPGYSESVPGVNTPNISLPGYSAQGDVTIPAFNPPVPNRAWTEMRKNLSIKGLSEEEKRDLYMGRNGVL